MSNKTTKLDARSVRLEVDHLTRTRYERARTHFGAVRDSESTIGEKAEAGDYITRDLFASLLSPGSKVNPETDGTPVRRVLDWATENLQRLPEWRSIAGQAKDNVVTSALATEAVVRHLADLDWPEPPAEDPDRDVMEKTDGGLPFKMEWKTRGATVETTRDRNGKRTTSSKNYGSPAAAKKAIEKAKREAARRGFSPTTKGPSAEAHAQAMEAFAASLEQNPHAGLMFRANAVGAVRKAAEAADAAESALAVSYGLDGLDERLADPDAEALEMAQAVASSPDLAKFLKLIGSFMESMQSSPNRKRVRGHVQPYDIAPTRDIRHLIPSELAMLGCEATRTLTIARIAEGRALGWEFADMGTKERGPMFVALDLSGSMRRRQTEAKAFAVAAALHAADNGRRVGVATFNGSFHLVADDVSASTDARASFVRDVLTRRAGGGTDFRPVVNHAAGLDASTDVLLISDGVGEIDEHRTRETFRTRDLHYLVIGDEGDVDPTLRSVAAGRMMTTDDIESGRAVDFAASAGATR